MNTADPRHDGTPHQDEGLVRRSTAGQFPRRAAPAVRRLASGGTVTAVYRLGDAVVMRLPPAAGGAGDVVKEQEWLPRLAPLPPVDVPEVLAAGEPAGGCPWRWSVHRRLPGAHPRAGALDRPVPLARDLAVFVTAMRHLTLPRAPQAHRGGPLALLDAPRVRVPGAGGGAGFADGKRRPARARRGLGGARRAGESQVRAEESRARSGEKAGCTGRGVAIPTKGPFRASSWQRSHRRAGWFAYVHHAVPLPRELPRPAMPHVPTPFSRARSAATVTPGTTASLPRTRTGGRGALRAGAIAASVAAFLSTGALGPAQAAPGRAASATATAAQPRTQGEQRVTAAVLDLDGTGRQPKVYGDDTAYDTASIVKVDILATLLLQAQDAGRRLTAQERTLATAMIERSDNASANALWRETGEAPGLEAANRRLGLTETQGGSGAQWGLTRTTASDQTRLLRAVFDTGQAGRSATPVLDEDSRTYIRTLMAGVVDEQAWGVSAAGSAGAALKNGWLQRSTTGLWDVNSIGRITGTDGHHYLVVVLSDGSRTMQDGVSLVQREARAAVTAAAASR